MARRGWAWAFLIFLGVFLAGAVGQQVVETEVCVYGGTSGGIVAAVELTRLGHRVELLAPTAHLGGMTTGGLSYTDIGNAATIGGLAREFYQRVGARYGRTEAFAFEPKIAAAVFDTMLQEAGITPRRNQRLASVLKTGGAITELRTAPGLRVRARIFIDATYEGDLLAAAGVSFTVGRESRAQYGEALAGVITADPLHQFDYRVDPFRRPADARSGLSAGLFQEAGAEGSGDAAVQAYNYRLCLTNNPVLRRPIARPRDYAEENYTLLARYLAARAAAGRTTRLREVLYFAPLPGRKFDVNANGPFSTDAVGLSAGYPLASDAGRAVIAAQHRRWIEGLIYFLANSTAVPAPMRWEMRQFGLCSDEFRATAGWPPQLYVREARRMVGAYVVQQADCEGSRRAADSIALGSYALDSHICRRVVEGGRVRNEGGFFQRLAEPYRIPYRAIVPRVGECSNLLVTFAVSASHVAFGSLRMEPVFMMLSQSAAQAAAIALASGVAVQEVPYATLAPRLTARGQILKWPLPPTGTIVVDNADARATPTGAWTLSSAMPGFYDDDYAIARASGGATAPAFSFRAGSLEPGEYDVFLRWTAAPNRARSVPVEVNTGSGTFTVVIDQTRNGSQWVKLGRWSFGGAQSPSITLRSGGTDGYIVADAAAWRAVSAAALALPETELVRPGN